MSFMNGYKVTQESHLTRRVLGVESTWRESHLARKAFEQS